MNVPKWSMTFICVALTTALALGVDWLAAEWIGIGSPQTRWWLLTVVLVLVAASLAFLWGNERTRYREAIQDVELLGRSGAHQIALNRRNSGEVRSLDEWTRAFNRLHERMSGMARRLEELDRERAAYEHRARSFESQSRQVFSVLSALAEPVLVIDKRDNLVLTNSSANRLLSIPSDAKQDRELASLVRCERLVELLTDTRKRQAFTQRSCEIEVPDDQGGSHWYRVTARNIPTQAGDSDPDGTSQGAVALLHDISSQRVLQKRNAEFVTAVSHEMKTPLSCIKAYVELLADGDVEDANARQESLHVISTQADRLQQLVDDLVELARIEADLAGENKSIQPLIPLFKEALESVRPLAAAKGVRLDTDWSGLDLQVAVDRPLFCQAAVHLLSNAVKYTPCGGRVTLGASARGREIVFEVKDTGVGIAAGDCQRIFEKFYRIAKDKQMADGSGLGLPLVKHIVEDVHGGRLEVQSTPGEGSVFRVRLANAGIESDIEEPLNEGIIS